MKPESRSRALREANHHGACVIYVMSRDQRVRYNHALLAAQQDALKHQLPLLVVFCLSKRRSGRTREQYQFMVEGLKQVERDLRVLDIPFMLLSGTPTSCLRSLLHHTNPRAVYFDFSPLHGPRILQQSIANASQCSVYVVDTHNIVPVWRASTKQEYAARTLRPKIQRQLTDWLEVPDTPQIHPYKWPGTVVPLDKLQKQIRAVLALQPSNNQKLTIQAGETAAHRTLRTFMRNRLRRYVLERNDPTKQVQSELSPYLHFGQISSLEVVLEVEAARHADSTLSESAEAFLEEIIIRKELSDNFCYYAKHYRDLSGISSWAKQTLHDHATDPREHLYSYKQLEDAQTHDELWNSAQRQLLRDGRIHGYMRMYWAKKVLEWTDNVATAQQYLIRLNDFYHLDGGDPNGYVGILWSIAGLHDRPWFNRPIFGTVRYMNQSGATKKFDVERYNALTR